MSKGLEGLKRDFLHLIEEARIAALPLDERDELIEFIKGQAERIFYSPSDTCSPYDDLPPPEHDDRPAPWWDR